MDMRMKIQFLSPGMKHLYGACLCTKISIVRRQFQECLGYAGVKQGVHGLPV